MRSIACIRSQRKSPAFPASHVAICENGSGDDSADVIRRAIDDNGWSSWCTLTALDVNLGFTGGNNAILRPAMESADQPQYFLLLNSDTIVRPNAFKALVDFMDNNPKVGIAGSRLEDPDGTPQRSAFRFQSPLGEFEGSLKLGLVSRLLERWVVAPPVVDHAFETDWVSGASMIIRRETMEATWTARRRLFHLFRRHRLLLQCQESRVANLVRSGKPRGPPGRSIDGREQQAQTPCRPIFWTRAGATF